MILQIACWGIQRSICQFSNYCTLVPNPNFSNWYDCRYFNKDKIDYQKSNLNVLFGHLVFSLGPKTTMKPSKDSYLLIETFCAVLLTFSLKHYKNIWSQGRNAKKASIIFKEIQFRSLFDREQRSKVHKEAVVLFLLWNYSQTKNIRNGTSNVRKKIAPRTKNVVEICVAHFFHQSIDFL